MPAPLAPIAEPTLPPPQLAVARAAQVQRLCLRLARGDYPLSPGAIAEALIAYGCATGDLALPVSAGRRDAATALMIDALTRLAPPTAMGLQLSLVEQLPDTAIAPLLGTECERLAMERKAAFAALRARLAG